MAIELIDGEGKREREETAILKLLNSPSYSPFLSFSLSLFLSPLSSLLSPLSSLLSTLSSLLLSPL
jgi:hypothetical protein